MKVELIKTFYAEAAHENPRERGPQGRMHGHSYRLDVVSAGELDPERGWLMDYADIKECFRPIHRQLDHACLNHVKGMEETHLEAVRGWIRARIPQDFQHFHDVRVRILGDCSFKPVWLPADDRLGLPERIGFGIEAAHYLPRVPREHQCRRLHGHSYRIEVGAEKLDALEQRLRDVYDQLDHSVLNDRGGLENPTSEHLSRWIWDCVRTGGIQPTAVAIQETCTAGCVYRGE